MTVARRNRLKCPSDREYCDEYHEDLVHELSRRLDTLRRCEQYIVNANGYPVAIEFWQDVIEQEADNVKRLQILLKTLTNQQDVRCESHMLCDSGELLSVSSIEVL